MLYQGTFNEYSQHGEIRNNTRTFWLIKALIAQVGLLLNCQSQQLSSVLSSACDFKSFLQTVWEQSDLGPHCLPVCKNRLKKFARLFSRQHKQTTFSDAGFLGVLRVN